ncbi:MAG: YcaO-like family protein [Oscillospiraceae bacterium]
MKMVKDNATEWQKRGKDASPENTVRKINEALDKAGIPVKYEDFPSDAGGMYHSRIEVTSITQGSIGANGKGASKELCSASAHAELMERLQNKMFCSGPAAIDNDFISKEKELLDKPWYTVRGDYQPRCVLELKKRFAQTVKKSGPFDPEPMDLVESLMEDVAYGNQEGKYVLRPFWSMKDHKEVMLPVRLLQMFQMSNGMAAGNSLEEAIIQATSEIFERYANIAVIRDNITPPEVPRDYIKEHYPKLFGIIAEIESRGKYRVYMLDCSLGQGLPVVCGVIINTETQAFGVKFGSHPDMAVALERTLSEAMQGQTIEHFSNSGFPNFEPNSRASFTNTWNLIKVGFGYYPASLLFGKPAYEFKPWKDVSGMDNRQVMKEMLSKLDEMSGDVYIQDVSFMGFPTVFIYASGISEVLPIDVLELKREKLRQSVQRILRNIDTATDADIERVIRFCIINRYALIENSYNNIAWMNFKKKIPGCPDEAGFLIAMCCYRLGKYKESLMYLESIKPSLGNMSPEDRNYYSAVRSYVGGMAYNESRENIESVIRKMCTADVAEKVIDDMSDPKKVLEKVYPVCNHGDCAGCVHRSECEYTESTDLFYKLIELESKADIGTEELAKLFE